MLAIDFIEKVNKGGDIILTDTNAKKSINKGDFTVVATRDTVTLGDARNFNKRGKKCKIAYYDKGWWTLVLEIRHRHPGLTIQQLFDEEVQIEGLRFDEVENKCHKLFTIDKLPAFGKMTKAGIEKLKKNYNKVDKTTLLKLLASGAVNEITQNYIYTDDYAFDASENFCKGKTVSTETIVSDLLHFSGTYAEVRDFNQEDKTGVISFLVHSNNSVAIHYSLAS